MCFATAVVLMHTAAPAVHTRGVVRVGTVGVVWGSVGYGVPLRNSRYHTCRNTHARTHAHTHARTRALGPVGVPTCTALLVRWIALALFFRSYLIANRRSALQPAQRVATGVARCNRRRALQPAQRVATALHCVAARSNTARCSSAPRCHVAQPRHGALRRLQRVRRGGGNGVKRDTGTATRYAVSSVAAAVVCCGMPCAARR
jgi:hypothetical protein